MTKPLAVILDDDPDFNELIKHYLKKIDIAAKTFSTSNDFTRELEKTKADLYIIDLNLDNDYGGGFHLIPTTRKKIGPQVPIFAISRRSSRKDISNALELGADDYLIKPLDQAIFLSKVQHYLLPTQEKNLPFFPVDQDQSDCCLESQIYLTEVSEFGLYFASNYLLAKGPTFSVSGDEIKKITGRNKLHININQSWFEEERATFASFYEYDIEDDDLLFHVKQWLAGQS